MLLKSCFLINLYFTGRYKDGILVRVGEVGDMKGRHYTVEKVKQKDAGHYRCLAITFGGDHARMSRPARLTVMRKHLTEPIDKLYTSHVSG